MEELLPKVGPVVCYQITIVSYGAYKSQLTWQSHIQRNYMHREINSIIHIRHGWYDTTSGIMPDMLHSLHLLMTTAHVVFVLATAFVFRVDISMSNWFQQMKYLPFCAGFWWCFHFLPFDIYNKCFQLSDRWHLAWQLSRIHLLKDELQGGKCCTRINLTCFFFLHSSWGNLCSSLVIADIWKQWSVFILNNQKVYK